MDRNRVISSPGIPAPVSGRDENEGKRQSARSGAYESPRAAARRTAELLYLEQRRRLHAAGKRERQ